MKWSILRKVYFKDILKEISIDISDRLLIKY